MTGKEQNVKRCQKSSPTEPTNRAHAGQHQQETRRSSSIIRLASRVVLHGNPLFLPEKPSNEVEGEKGNLEGVLGVEEGANGNTPPEPQRSQQDSTFLISAISEVIDEDLIREDSSKTMFDAKSGPVCEVASTNTDETQDSPSKSSSRSSWYGTQEFRARVGED